MNRVELVGRLTKDPELRYTKENVAVASFTVAINRQFKSENEKQEVDYIQCKAFNKRAETIKKYCSKGSQVAIEGSIRTGNYEKEGKTYYTTEVFIENIQFIGSKPTPEKKETTREERDKIYEEFGNSIEISDEDIAF